MIQRPTDIKLGRARHQARESLFTLVVGLVSLSLWANFFASFLMTPHPAEASWWGWLLGGGLLLGFSLLWVSIWWDDRRLGRDEAKIELLLPYMVQGNKAQVTFGMRRSYTITRMAQEAWRNTFSTGLSIASRKEEFQTAIFPEHMELLRHLLVVYLAGFGKKRQPDEALHSWWPSAIPLREMPWEDLPPSIRENHFTKSMDKALPQQLFLPHGARLEAFKKGPLLLRLSWRPHLGLIQRFLVAIFGLGINRPAGKITVRWVGLPSEATGRRRDHIIARLKEDLLPQAKVRVLSTRLLVEVETRWNLLGTVADFRDWGVQLANNLKARMDYWSWRDYYLERTIDDLDWKIGWIAKNEPGIVKRLEKIEARLAELAARGEPSSPVRQDSS